MVPKRLLLCLALFCFSVSNKACRATLHEQNCFCKNILEQFSEEDLEGLIDCNQDQAHTDHDFSYYFVRILICVAAAACCIVGPTCLCVCCLCEKRILSCAQNVWRRLRRSGRESNLENTTETYGEIGREDSINDGVI